MLAEIAAALGFDRAAFEAGLAEPALEEETARDYAVSQRAGITGFPTLIIGPQADRTFAMVSQGFNTLAPVAARIETWLVAQAATTAEPMPASASTGR